MKEKKLELFFFLAIALSILETSSAVGEINFCFIMPFMRSKADIEILKMKSDPFYRVKRGKYITSSTKFRLKSGKIKTAKIRSYVYKNALRLYTFDKVVDKSMIGHDFPLGPGVYTIKLRQLIFDYSPEGLINTKSKLYINGEEFQCVLKDIYILGN